MALLLTNDEEAVMSTLLVFRRSIGKAKNSGPTMCRATRRTSERRSNHMRNPLMRSLHSFDGRRGNALIAFKNRQSRQRRISRGCTPAKSFGRSLRFFSSDQNLRPRMLKYPFFEHQLFVLIRVASIDIFR